VLLSQLDSGSSPFTGAELDKQRRAHVDAVYFANLRVYAAQAALDECRQAPTGSRGFVPVPPSSDPGSGEPTDRQEIG
jgi:hypothetical protein